MKASRQMGETDISSKSLGTASPRDLLCQQVAQAAQLREGARGVENFLRALARGQPRTLKALAQQLAWPLPVTAAVRRELEKRHILDRQGGLRLTEQGRSLCGDSEALGDVCRRCPHCAGSGWEISKEVSAALLAEIKTLCQARPAVDVTLDQALATPETNLRRVLYLLSAVSLQNRRVVFLGDDDWTSASLALALRKLYPGEGAPGCRIEVVDIDARIVQALNAWAGREGMPLEAIQHDLRQPLSLPGKGSADVVFTDPPYTEAGLALFCRWAREFLPKDRGELFLCYPVRDPQRHYEVASVWNRLGFVLLDSYRGWNQYVGNSLHAGQSAFWHLQAVRPGGRVQHSVAGESIYTFDARSRKTRRYRCRQCGCHHPVGPGHDWHTIEALKKAGCTHCGGQVFSRC